MGARILVLLLVVSATAGAATTKRQVTVWKSQARVADGNLKPFVLIGQAPDDLLPACRCATGAWKIAAKGGETATHFVGTLDAPTFNHARAAKKKLSVKVRKTRDLMGVHRDYRAALLGIMRGSGQLVLREVAGGEWEVVGYAPEPIGKLFANNPRWKADAKHPPKPAAASPIVETKAPANPHAKRIND